MCLQEIQKRATLVGGAPGQSHAHSLSHSHGSQSTGAGFCRGGRRWWFGVKAAFRAWSSSVNRKSDCNSRASTHRGQSLSQFYNKIGQLLTKMSSWTRIVPNWFIPQIKTWIWGLVTSINTVNFSCSYCILLNLCSSEILFLSITQSPGQSQVQSTPQWVFGGFRELRAVQDQIVHLKKMVNILGFLDLGSLLSDQLCILLVKHFALTEKETAVTFSPCSLFTLLSSSNFLFEHFGGNLTSMQLKLPFSSLLHLPILIKRPCFLSSLSNEWSETAIRRFGTNFVWALFVLPRVSAGSRLADHADHAGAIMPLTHRDMFPRRLWATAGTGVPEQPPRFRVMKRKLLTFGAGGRSLCRDAVMYSPRKRPQLLRQIQKMRQQFILSRKRWFISQNNE